MSSQTSSATLRPLVWGIGLIGIALVSLFLGRKPSRRIPVLTLARLQSDLLLTEKQMSEIGPILDSFSAQQSHLRQEGQSRINQVLTQPQKEKFIAIQTELDKSADAFSVPRWAIMLICAEMLLFIVRSRQFNILIKTPQQRTQRENKEVNRGLFRCVALEALIFVPVSVVLVFVTIRPFAMLLPPVSAWSQSSQQMDTAVHAMLGIASYGFPFLTFRRLVLAVAFGAIKEFARIRVDNAGSRPHRVREARQ